jgi:hypothetical protein
MRKQRCDMVESLVCAVPIMQSFNGANCRYLVMIYIVYRRLRSGPLPQANTGVGGGRQSKSGGENTAMSGASSWCEGREKRNNSVQKWSTPQRFGSNATIFISPTITSVIGSIRQGSETEQTARDVGHRQVEISTPYLDYIASNFFLHLSSPRFHEILTKQKHVNDLGLHVWQNILCTLK